MKKNYPRRKRRRRNPTWRQYKYELTNKEDFQGDKSSTLDTAVKRTNLTNLMVSPASFVLQGNKKRPAFEGDLPDRPLNIQNSSTSLDFQVGISEQPLGSIGTSLTQMEVAVPLYTDDDQHNDGNTGRLLHEDAQFDFKNK